VTFYITVYQSRFQALNY